MKLSNNFYLKEFVKSYTADRLQIDNTPTLDVIENLERLCLNVLQPIRDHFGVSVKVNSGFRCKDLNKKVRGKITSQHIKGEAADIEIEGISNASLYDWIKNNLDFDQLILEYYNRDIPDSGWVHVSYKKGKNRKQALLIK